MDNRNSLEQLSISKFNEDASALGGYRYARSERLSTCLAVMRRSRAIREALATLEISNKSARVIDIGCGDGTYTRELIQREWSVVGIDAAEQAILIARQRLSGHIGLSFEVGNASQLPSEDQSYDLAVMREVLHHLDNPALAIKEAARVARHVLILDPNGYNPVLKILEKTSRYHIEHGERSYTPKLIDLWMHKAGIEVSYRRYTGIIPVFAPDTFARLLNRIEPLMEGLPLARAAYCASVVLLGRSKYTGHFK